MIVTETGYFADKTSEMNLPKVNYPRNNTSILTRMLSHGQEGGKILHGDYKILRQVDYGCRESSSQHCQKRIT